jgi:tetratricopeptide (TPR) repeat protein
MRERVLAAAMLVAISTTQASAQTPNDEPLKAVVRAETKAYFDRSFEAWQAGWVHDANVARTLIGYGDDTTVVGWDNISAAVAKEFKGNPTPNPAEATIERFSSRQDGNLAWVEYDQVLTFSQAPEQKGMSREKRLLVRQGGQWKIASQITIGGHGLEDQINGLGYRLLGEKKTQEAIDILKINVRLYPESWNVYDSLGEAYALAGQNDLAIQNYEKSLQLNPKNEGGRAALAKLKAK